jgi:agmatinase
MVGAVNVPWKTVVTDLADVVDCGDVRMSAPAITFRATLISMSAMIPFDNKVAIRQLEEANKDILQRNASRQAQDRSIAKDGLYHPRVLTLASNIFHVL